jgi:hypothetical protein
MLLCLISQNITLLSLNSVVGIGTDWFGWLRNQSSSPCMVFPLHVVEIGSGAHLAPYPVSTKAYFL